MNRLSQCLLVVVLLVLVQPAFAAGKAGEITLARGVVTAYAPGSAARIVGAGSGLEVGDVVSTARRSVAILKLDDGTRITLRPESTFEITAFDTRADQENALFTLFKGGMRAVTGFLSKRNPRAVRLRTSMATIGIRGTELDARLCEGDCAADAARRPVPAGRAGFVRGQILARATSGRARTLESGAPVYVGDTLVSGAASYAVIAFRDDSRVTVLPNTEFRVENLDFQPAEAERSSAVFRLLRGGLRAVTGLIGKRRYRMHTAVATIGIRGTGYDLFCQGSCQNPAADAGPDGDGLFTEVWDGSIVIDDVYVVDSGQAVFLADTGFAPVPVPGLPVPMDQPQPDAVDLPPAPPPPPSSSNPQDGLYVSCYAGNCAVETDQNVVELSAGQASFVGGDGVPAESLPEVPPFQAEDPVLYAAELGAGYSGFDQSIDGGGMQCTVP